MMDVGSDKKPLNRFDDKDRQRADQMFGKGKWVEHICSEQKGQWAIHSKEGWHKNDA